ncbi:MAG: amino acid adenylation domain-containing protein, partial [Moorea sp. SIO2I5]|nr:amino acid adenylation domain-containing protein [Moorena sp. SIO2I5]
MYLLCCPPPDQQSDRLVPIGKALPNLRLYILDSLNQLLPVGVAGELHIAGIQVGRGYLNRPELTAEKFIEVELGGVTERLYKVGDLVRWLPDGNLEYLGRIDHQVKLRGFRIELGEIEFHLMQHPRVKEAVVVLFNQDDLPRLVAYILPLDRERDPGTPTEAMAVMDLFEVLTIHLRASLPDY